MIWRISWGLKDRAGEMFAKASDGYAALAAKADGPGAAKGLRMFQAYALRAAGNYDAAAGVYDELVRSFPEEYPFHRSLASTLFRMKKSWKYSLIISPL